MIQKRTLRRLVRTSGCAMALVLGTVACQPAAPSGPPAPAARTAASDRPAGSAYSGAVHVTVSGGAGVSVGDLTAQVLPCNPVSAAASQNSAADIDTNIPTSTKVLALLSGTTANRGVVTFDHTKGTADVVETSTTQGVDLLGGLVTADVVQARAHVSHTGSVIDQHTADGTTGSTLQNLKIAGVPVLPAGQDPKPNTTLALPGGVGSITLDEVGPVPAFFTEPAGISVNALHLHLTNLLGVSGDIIVGHAQAGLGVSAGRVGGGGFLAAAAVEPVASTGFLGAFGMGCGGTSGTETYQQAAVTLPVVGSLGAGKITVNGAITSSAVTSKVTSSVGAVDLLDGEVTADAVTSAANSTADSSGVRSDGTGSTFAHLVIDGHAVAVTVPANTRIDLPGIGYVVLNEQNCTSDRAASSSCAADHRTAIDVTAVHVHVTVAGNPLGVPVGADVVVARAGSGVSD